MSEEKELNPEQLSDIAGGRDSGQYYRLGKENTNTPDDGDRELSDQDLGQVSGGSGDGGQYYRLGRQSQSAD